MPGGEGKLENVGEVFADKFKLMFINGNIPWKKTWQPRSCRFAVWGCLFAGSNCRSGENSLCQHPSMDWSISQL